MGHENKSKGKPCIEKVNEPTGEEAYHVLQFLFKYSPEEESIIEGDKYDFPELRNEKYGVKLVEAEAVKMPSYDDREDDEDDFNAKFKLTFHAYLSYYTNDILDPAQLKKLKENIAKRIDKNSKKEYIKILYQKVVFSNTEYHVVEVFLMCRVSWCRELIGDIVSSKLEEEYWKPLMDRLIKEGVCYKHGNVPVDLRDSLRSNINDLADKIPVDYHPNSKDIVRDLVHPAIYSYIEGVSCVRTGQQIPTQEGHESKDFWGRPYEQSKFQWLPTPFLISQDGKCSIMEYINNLDKFRFGNLYTDLEKLFDLFLPYFEEVWSYIKAIDFFTEEHDNEDWFDDWNHENSGNFNLESLVPPTFKLPPLNRQKVSFKGRELQVITKIVDYTLQPEQEYEGVWHAEGMSHENIVMTGIYFIDRGEELEGGDLRFKRAFTKAERSRVFSTVPQMRPNVFNDFASEGYLPLGKFPTDEGYMLVFPNCHIHKISKLINQSARKSSTRRIIVFFVVNPERKIISTREVEPQQDRISFKKAREYRLELMAERKYDKEKLNIRDIELCEH